MAKEPDTAENMAERARFRSDLEKSMIQEGLGPERFEEVLNLTVRVTDEVIDEEIEKQRKQKEE